MLSHSGTGGFADMALSSGAGGTHMPRMSFLVSGFEFELIEKKVIQ
jgi:hypothetical protein